MVHVDRSQPVLARRVVLLGFVAAAVFPASGENLARSAAYSVVVSGFAYRGQILPGTNTPAVTDGFADAPLWQGPADTLTDGKRDGNAVTSWFWSNMNKRIAARFDLRRAARVTRIGVWPQTGSNTGFEAVVARIAGTPEALSSATELVMTKEGGAFAWRGEPTEGRFVEVVCGSGAPQMTLSEVEVEGEAVGAFIAEAPSPGLQPVPQRNLAALVKLPDKPPGVTNVAARVETKVSVTSRHYDDKIGAWADDVVQGASEGRGRALIDGDRRTAVSSFSGWYSAKTITTELDLGQPWQIERIVVWSSGHDGPQRSYLNSFELWLQAAPGSAWMPVGEVRNPVLPGEKPGAEYPIISPVLARPGRSVRLGFVGAAQSADVVQVGEIEVWAKAVVGEVRTVPWRMKKPVPRVKPVKTGKLSPAFNWIRKERLRALYGYVGQWKDEGLLDKVVAAGFNSMVVHTMGATHKEDAWPQEVDEWARVQKQRKLHILISWPFGSDERYGNTQFGAYQPGGSTRWTHTPCPLSKRYWDKVVGDRAAVAAQAGLTGMVVDMEMYGADSTRYAGPCYCDECFGRFVGEHLEGINMKDLDLTDRPAWIAGNGLSADYARWQELEVTEILHTIEQRVHTANPAFLLGNLLDPETLPGLARGFGTPTMPALIFSELEYPGNVAGTPGREALLRDAGYPALYVPGFWIQPVTPPQLPLLVKEVGPVSAGYWIWSSAAFMENASGDYAHAKGYTHEDYWKAFRATNDLLTETLLSNVKGEKTTAPDVPKATIPRVSRPPDRDSDWDKGARLGPFLNHVSGAPAKAATEARALWDGKRLYLRIVCAEPELGKSPVLKGGRDDHTLWQQDSVEVFWMRPGSTTYAHVIVNAAGTVSDAMAEGLRAEDPGWNADIKVTARRGQKEWELSLSIPLEADGFGAIPAGGQVRFELARNRPGGGETTCWAPTRGMFKAAPNLWGRLTLQ